MQFSNLLTFVSLLSISAFSTLAVANEGALAVQDAPQGPAEVLMAREAMPDPKKSSSSDKNKTDDDKKSDAIGVAIPLGMLSVLGAGVVAGGILGF